MHDTPRVPVRAVPRWFVWLVLCAALTSTAEAQHGRKTRSNRTTFHVVGMVPFPGFVDSYAPALQDYLEREVGTQYEPALKFTIRQDAGAAAYDLAPFDDPIASARDFVFAPPNMASCFESEFFANPLVTQRVKRGVQELSHYGGVIYTLKSRTDINHVKDLKGKIVTASDFKLCQFQWGVIEDSGISFIADTAQIRFNPGGNKAIVEDVLSGNTDVGFARTDTIESFPAVDQDKLKVIGAVQNLMYEDKVFPFQTSSMLYPENTLLALAHVDFELQSRVVQALLNLDRNSSETKRANIVSFQPALSYAPAQNLMQELDMMTKDPVIKRWRCARSSEIYESIRCPAGSFKKTKRDVDTGCSDAGLPCPNGMACLCNPCTKAEILELTSTVKSLEPVTKNCSSMSVCATLDQNADVFFTLKDNKGRIDLNLSWVLHSRVLETQKIQTTKFVTSGKIVRNVTYWQETGKSTVYHFQVSSQFVGLHILEIRLGERSDDQAVTLISPIYIEVMPTKCQGANLSPNEIGICLCDRRSFRTPRGCAKAEVIICSIVVPIFVLWLLFQCATSHIRRKKNQEIQKLRQSLCIEEKDGFLLANEGLSFYRAFTMCFSLKSREDVFVSIPKPQLEAAVNLVRCEHFDINAFDAFCASICVVGVNHSQSSASLDHLTTAALELLPDRPPHSNTNAGGIEICINKEFGNSSRNYGFQNDDSRLKFRTHQASLVQKWLLEHTTAVLENVVHATSINPSHLHGASAQNSRKSRVSMSSHGDSEFLSNLFNVRLWNDGRIFQELKTACQLMTDGIAKDCNAVFRQILVEPGGQELRDFQWSSTTWANYGCPIAVHTTSHDAHNAAHEVIGFAFGNSDSQISIEQIEPSDELNVTPLGLDAVDCKDSEALAVSQEPGFTAYRGLESFHHGDAHDSLDSTAGTRQFEACRQDMEEVGAIPRPGPRELLERELEYLSPKPHVLQSPSTDQDIAQSSQQRVPRREEARGDESVFLAQLHRRACLLDRSFKMQVINSLLSTRDISQPSTPSSTADAPNWKYHHMHPRNASFTQQNSAVNIDLNIFDDGPAKLEIYFAPVKTLVRMREKLHKYDSTQFAWPISGNILDPVRLSIVCSSPMHVVQTVRWLIDNEHSTQLEVCRVKNKFHLSDADVEDGYRDISLNVIHTAPNGLKIVGEIQVHDRRLHMLKLKMHLLYKIKRANSPAAIV